MEKEVGELKLQCELLQKDCRSARRDNEKLKAAYDEAARKAEAAQDTLNVWTEAAKEKAQETAQSGLVMRETTRGRPMVHTFVHHCRTLLATGASGRSIREQLLLNGRFFLGELEYSRFKEQMPDQRWFQFQREGMGLESMVLTFMRLAKAERVDQWGFDETSLDGVPTLNQWCRILEGNEQVTLTIECAGLLPGSTSAKVTDHIEMMWARGQRVVAMVREELGDMADEYVPLVKGGVHLSKLQGSMHDTCNTANLVAKQVQPSPCPLSISLCHNL